MPTNTPDSENTGLAVIALQSKAPTRGDRLNLAEFSHFLYSEKLLDEH